MLRGPTITMRASAAGTPPAEGADLGRPLPTAIVASAAPGPPSLASPPPDDPDDNPSLLDIVVRRPRLLLVGAVLFGLLGVLYVGLNWTSYQATARLVLRDPWEADSGVTNRPVGGDFQRFVRSEARYLQTDEVVAAAAAILGTDPERLGPAVSASATASGEFIGVTVGGSSAPQAQRRLDAVLEAYSAARKDLVAAQAASVLQTIEQEAKGLQVEDRTELYRRAADLRIALASYDDGVAFVEKQPATPDIGALGKVLTPLLAAGFGTSLAAVLAWVWAGRRRRVEDPERLSTLWSLAFCGTLEPLKDRSSPRSRLAADAALLAIAAQLRHRPPRDAGGAYVVVLAASSPAVPTGAVAQRLADVAAGQGARCKVVEAAELTRTGTRPDLGSRDHDLVLFACGVPQQDLWALRMAGVADTVVLVVVAGDDANDVRRTLAFYDSAAQRPQACIALPRSAT